MWGMSTPKTRPRATNTLSEPMAGKWPKSIQVADEMQDQPANEPSEPVQAFGNGGTSHHRPGTVTAACACLSPSPRTHATREVPGTVKVRRKGKATEDLRPWMTGNKAFLYPGTSRSPKQLDPRRKREHFQAQGFVQGSPTFAFHQKKHKWPLRVQQNSPVIHNLKSPPPHPQPRERVVCVPDLPVPDFDGSMI